MKSIERITAEALILGADVIEEKTASLEGKVEVKYWNCGYCGKTTVTHEEAHAHDGECEKHPMAERAMVAETRVAELEKRIAELTADEAPRQAAERIMGSYLVVSKPGLLDAITTAIQAASNAQLKRGRKALAVYKSRDHIGNVREFMAKFQQHIGSAPGWPPQEVLDLRVRLIAEEFAEMVEAGGYEGDLWIARTEETKNDIEIVEIDGWCHESDEPSEEARKFPAFIDALIDMVYVILGTFIACGVDPQPIWEAVHAANLRKIPAADKGAKVLKPAGWVAPDVAGLLREQGWGGEK